MKWSESYIYTLKETPADAEIPSHKLMIRAGFIRKLAQGIYTYGPLALIAIRKFESIVREELNKVGCVELLMPMAHPKELWEETGRWTDAGLLKFKTRTDQELCLGATHEEVITDYVRKDIKSYRNLPVNLYQVQTKFRDEIRPRFGLMRGREFIMKDAYSFDLDKEQAYVSYEKMYRVYENIFKRIGVDFRSVQADSGNIGGDKSQEFHILAEAGEDHLLVDESSDFAANVEICPVTLGGSPQPNSTDFLKMEELHTPNIKSIQSLAEFCQLEAKELVKTMFFSIPEKKSKSKAICILLKGSDEVNPIKLKNFFGLTKEPELLSDKEVLTLTGAHPGSCGPVGLNADIYLDQSVQLMTNYIVGANKDDYHLKNVNHQRDYEVKAVGDFCFAKEGDLAPNGKSRLKSIRGIEVGHIFYLGTKYSKVMGANYLDKQGKSQPIEMGCYGIGVSRTVQAVIEQSHDQDGMVWPMSLAPFQVHICLLDPKDEAISSLATGIYEDLKALGIDCLLDDRDERPGFKFKDADLLGMPFRLVIGKRGVESNSIELVERKNKKKESFPPDQVVAVIKERLVN